MAWTNDRTGLPSSSALAFERGGRSSAGRGVAVLPMPADTRERLACFYRERDEEDALRFASGAQKVRGTIWTVGLRNLERGDAVYESYGVIAAAGIELPPEARKIIDKLPDDWRRICHIETSGAVTTASLKARMRSGR